MNRIALTAPAGNRIRLENLAKVSAGQGEDLARFRVNGRPAIAVQIFKQEEADTVDVVERAQAKFREFADRYPGLDMLPAGESASFTRQVVNNMLGSVWQALLLATLVIYLARS